MTNSVGKYTSYNISEKVWQKVDSTELSSFNSFLKKKLELDLYIFSETIDHFLKKYLLS